MIIFLHVVIALCGIVVTSLAALFPTTARLRAGGILIAATLLSGTYLVAHLHSSLMQSCLTGLAYLAVTVSSVVIGQYRLATAKQSR